MDDRCGLEGWGCSMVEGEKQGRTLKVRIDSELLDRLKSQADKLGTDVSTYVRWCIQTGLYLENVNKFIRSKSREDEKVA